MKNTFLPTAITSFVMLTSSLIATAGEEEKRASFGDRISSQEMTIRSEVEFSNKETLVMRPSEEILKACEKCTLENSGKVFSVGENKSGLLQKNLYFTTNSNALHFVTAVTRPYGDSVQFEDGSICSIFSVDAYKTLNWLTSDNILIMPNTDYMWSSLYPYVLQNQQTGVRVQATFIAAPWVDGAYSRWIYSIDYYNRQICLNDSSVWTVPVSESWILNSFLPGDYVFMGFNNSPGNGLGANILINFSTMQFVYSTCIYY